jgi:hypothetical protein
MSVAIRDIQLAANADMDPGLCRDDSANWRLAGLPTATQLRYSLRHPSQIQSKR